MTGRVRRMNDEGKMVRFAFIEHWIMSEEFTFNYISGEFQYEGNFWISWVSRWDIL